MQLPAGLTNLCFGFDFDQSLRNVQLVGLRGGTPTAMDDVASLLNVDDAGKPKMLCKLYI